VSEPTDRKRLIVSGGSRGLGLALVQHSLARGHAVATFARSETDAVRALAAKYGEQLLFAALDARDSAGQDAFVATAEQRFGAIDGLVNNAAVGQDHLLTHVPPDRIDEILDVNLKGPLLLTRAVVRRMIRAGGGGRIVNITSICGGQGYAGLTVYSATKGAMDAFTRSLAREIGPRGILVNAIAPGFFVSEMSAVLASEQINTIRRRTPTERLIDHQDILPLADMLLFADINVTGQVIHADGGLSS
jgi:3-oxoacyl-[acyl-carrier protein] reductase